jgi:hypothetical protein
MEGLIRAGVAHFYFVTIHPFEDGNGRRLAGKRRLKNCGTSAKPWAGVLSADDFICENEKKWCRRCQPNGFGPGGESWCDVFHLMPRETLG